MISFITGEVCNRRKCVDKRSFLREWQEYSTSSLLDGRDSRIRRDSFETGAERYDTTAFRELLTSINSRHLAFRLTRSGFIDFDRNVNR